MEGEIQYQALDGASERRRRRKHEKEFKQEIEE